MKGFLGFGNNKKLQTNNQSNIHFELCGCKSEVLVLKYDREIGLMDLAIFEHSISFINKMSWFQKLRYIWQVCRYNKPYADQIVLEKDQMNNLYFFLRNTLSDG